MQERCPPALVIFHGLEVSHGSCPPSKRRNYANASGKNGPWGATSRSADARDRGRGTTGGSQHPPLPPALGASPIGPKMTLRRDRFGGEREHVAQPRLPSRETSPEPLLWRISQLLRRNRGKGWSLFPSRDGFSTCRWNLDPQQPARCQRENADCPGDGGLERWVSDVVMRPLRSAVPKAHSVSAKP